MPTAPLPNLSAHWGNIVIIPLIITLMCIGFGISESIVERSVRKALLRGALALPLGIFLGFIFDMMAEIIYGMGMRLSLRSGSADRCATLLFGLFEALAWTVFGAAGGVVYGIVGQSTKKGTYGVLGGALGAGLGGVIFNPIAHGDSRRRGEQGSRVRIGWPRHRCWHGPGGERAEGPVAICGCRPTRGETIHPL